MLRQAVTLALLSAPPDSPVVRDIEVAPGETLRTRRRTSDRADLR